jgi:predicted dinucleotide-binding enzyme
MSSNKVGILGSGHAGQALSKGFSTVGYEVKIGSRSPDNPKSKIDDAERISRNNLVGLAQLISGE